MTPQEKDLITQLLDRLKQAGGQPKDPEAEALIKAAVQATPDMPYVLVQTALIQNMSLEGAQARIQELEREVAQAKEAAAAKPTSFLGGLLGGGSRPAPQPAQSMVPRSGGSVPQAGGYAQQPQQPPGYAQGPMQAPPAAGGGGSFLRTAAGVAAGVAGGALLYHGLSSMFSGGHGMGAGSQSFMGGGQGANSPWGNPQAGSSDQIANNLSPERDAGNQQDYGQDRDSAYQSDSGSSDDSGGWNNSDSGSDSGGGWDSGDSGGSSSDDY
jgi:hypothetical protein